MTSVFIYGGAFDPVHNGHINTAQSVYNFFTPDKLLFVPCGQPVFKPEHHSNAKHRLAMLERALESLQPQKKFSVCTFELHSQKPSYTIRTLEHLHQTFPKHTVMTLIIGADAFLAFHKWHQWNKIIDLCNILVLKRANYPLHPLPSPLQDLMQKHATDSLETLTTIPAGAISVFDAGKYIESSTKIRECQQQHKPIDAFCPPGVAAYIQQHHLYE